MRFLRLRIANYRGVPSAEVTFTPTGITLIQGPNEAGKTSLGEAIRLLFEYPDSSKDSAIRAIRPVHRDEGPEIELQAKSGPYAFTYFKRFYKKPETRLTVTKPKPENHTGREAHERADVILRETIDIGLWKALTVQQGDAIDQPRVANQTSLSAALDKAAGGHPAAPQGEGLFDKVYEEYGRYFTEGGREKKELQETRKQWENAQSEVAEIERQIRDLEQDIERAATLQRELGQLRKQEGEQREAVRKNDASLEEIAALEGTLTTARLKLESAQKSVDVARRDVKARQELIDAVSKAVKEHDELQKSGAMSLQALKHAEDSIKKAQESFNEADGKRKEADSLAALRRADFDYYNNKLHFEQLLERKERIDEARRKAAKAEAVLARNRVDSRALKTIEDAERELLIAKAQLEKGAPNIRLHAISKCRVLIDDNDTVLDMSEDRTISVADRTQVTIPGALDIEVTAGSSIEGLSKKVEESQRGLQAICQAKGVLNPDEARLAFDERREASRHIELKGQVEKENLRDLTDEQLEKKLLSLQQNVPDYLDRRAKEPIICSDMESSKKEWANAEDAQRKANIEWETARESFDAARTVHDSLKTKYQEVCVKLDVLAKELSLANEKLKQARNVAPDNSLEVKLKEASLVVSSEEVSVRDAEASLKTKNPERVKALAEAVRGSLQTTQNRLSAAQTEMTEIQTRLKIHGEEGLHEKLHAAQTRLERIEADNKALFQRALSAKFLFEIMREERDRARRAYVAPLREKIEHLGRLVFDESFQVEISEDLRVASRTVGGVTVPFDSLSGGTKEQISLIFRLACSMIVARDGGAPLILDDTLGYTDTERLGLMGAVMAKAAKECQIIIFTCVPERYSNVGEATVVSLI